MERASGIFGSMSGPSRGLGSAWSTFSGTLSEQQRRASRSSSDSVRNFAGTRFFAERQSLIVPNMGWTQSRRKAHWLMYSNSADVVIGLIILFDIGLIWIDIDSRAAGLDTPEWVIVMMSVCYAIYCVEISIRFYIARVALFKDSWGYLDVAIIVFGLLEYLLQFLSVDMSSLGVIRNLRLVRLTRVVRAIKLFGSLRELRKLLAMMGGCFRTLVWSFVLCFLVMTVWACSAVEVLHPLVNVLVKQGEWSDCDQCPDAFSTVLRADMTIFQTVVAGDSWGKMATPLMEAYPWTAFIFVGALLTLVFGVLNLVVAVVVDSSAEIRETDIKNAARELDFEEVHEKNALLRIFSRIDTDQNGTVSFPELQDAASSMEDFRHWLRVLDVDDGDLLQLFRILDRDSSGEVGSQDFIEALYRLKHTESKTAVRIVKHLVSDMHKRLGGLELQVDDIAQAVGRRTRPLTKQRTDRPNRPRRAQREESGSCENSASSPEQQLMGQRDNSCHSAAGAHPDLGKAEQAEQLDHDHDISPGESIYKLEADSVSQVTSVSPRGIMEEVQSAHEAVSAALDAALRETKRAVEAAEVVMNEAMSAASQQLRHQADTEIASCRGQLEHRDRRQHAVEGRDSEQPTCERSPELFLPPAGTLPDGVSVDFDAPVQGQLSLRLML
mmetsp:Transcript_16727/g.36689  ORF Transcript_16727/g.36689 Transcript_16727/m.36689 type:complete len:667 (+) Transcript_16727:34-2034(+)